jgi:L-methionine (R)-S-oxide reductase
VVILDYKLAEDKIRKIFLENYNVLTNIVNFLHKNFNHYNWVGIYVVQGDNLILKAWNGKQATEHTKIPIGKGICGSAAASGKTEIVDDVSTDKRYLSCFISTKSEIVVPIKKNKKVLGEIDIDSDRKNAFSKKDKIFLENLADMLCEHIH